MRWLAAGDEGVIDKVAPRRNLLFRQDEWKTKSFAANLDQLLVLVAGEPVFSESQLTRALIAAQAAGIPTCIGLNKIDLPATAAARARLAPYAASKLYMLMFAKVRLHVCWAWWARALLDTALALMGQGRPAEGCSPLCTP